MEKLLNLYQNKSPEIVFGREDPRTEAEGWTVINSLRLVLSVEGQECGQALIWMGCF